MEAVLRDGVPIWQTSGLLLLKGKVRPQACSRVLDRLHRPAVHRRRVSKAAAQREHLQGRRSIVKRIDLRSLKARKRPGDLTKRRQINQRSKKRRNMWSPQSPSWRV